MAAYLQKWTNAKAIIRQNGGIVGSFLKLFREDELKFGKCVGEDKYGNKYYHNTYYIMGRSRWVEYSNRAGWDYNASQVPAEWHGWLHYMTDETPVTHPRTQQKFMIDHKENMTDTKDEYVPYSTTKPRVQSWTPPK